MGFKGLLPRRKLDSHKGNYGRVLVFAGSAGLTGAAYLCAQGALLCGSGLVTLGIPRSLNSIMEVKLTEVMTRPLPETRARSLDLEGLVAIERLLRRADTVALGPGLSRNIRTQQLIRKILTGIIKPVVIDADGINALVGNLFILDKIRATAVLTPHPGEMARLLPETVTNIQNNRAKIAGEFAKKYGVILVLKGYKTVVASPKGATYINTTGNPGMASGGSGDILPGMIASFIGQGIDPFEASKLGVYLHGLAADYAAKEKGQPSLIATDILDRLPQAIKTVTSRK